MPDVSGSGGYHKLLTSQVDLKADMDIRGKLKNLNGISVKDLPSLSDPALEMMLRRVEGRIQRPGASISGYNGAGGLSGNIAVDVRETK